MLALGPQAVQQAVREAVVEVQRALLGVLLLQLGDQQAAALPVQADQRLAPPHLKLRPSLGEQQQLHQLE